MEYNWKPLTLANSSLHVEYSTHLVHSATTTKFSSFLWPSSSCQDVSDMFVEFMFLLIWAVWYYIPSFRVFIVPIFSNLLFVMPGFWYYICLLIFTGLHLFYCLCQGCFIMFFLCYTSQYSLCSLDQFPGYSICFLVEVSVNLWSFCPIGPMYCNILVS